MNKTTWLIFTYFFTLSLILNAQSDNTILAQQTNTDIDAAIATPKADSILASQYLQRANYLYNANRYDSLTILANQASAIFLEQNEWADYIEAQVLTAMDLYLKNDLEASKELSDEILTKSKDYLGEKHFATARAYMQRGIIAMAELDDQLALEHFTTAHTILADAPGQTTTIAKLYTAIGLIHHIFRDNPEKALSYCEAALTIMKHKLDSSDAILGNIYSEIGLLHTSLEQYDEALLNFEKALKIYYRSYSNNLMAVATVNYNIGLVKIEQEKYEESIESFEKALELVLLTTGGENQLAVNVYTRIGQIYLRQLEDRITAMPYLKKAITTAKKVNEGSSKKMEYRYRILGKYYLGE